MTTVSVDELQRAWAAVEAGEFRTRHTPLGTARRTPTAAGWAPDGPVIVVAGVAGRVGASTVAVALATAARGSARVVECASMHTSGLAAATDAELGVTDRGWHQGIREDVLIERTSAPIQHPGDVPVPEPSERDLTIVDVGWDLCHLLAAGESGWLAGVVQTAPMVLVTVATVPGLHCLDTALHLTGRADETWCVVRGPRRARWPRPLNLATTASIDASARGGRLLTVPEHPSLALTGLTPDPLSPRLVTACRPLVDQMVEHTKGTHDASQF